MEDKSYSINGEEYYDFDTVMCDLTEDYKDGDKAEIFEGDTVSYSHSDFLHHDHIVEEMQERAYEESPEFSDSYLDDVSEDKKKELNKIICDWLDKNAKAPNFFTVKNVKKITVIVEE